MKTVILGAGSLGSVIGGFLAESGQDITLVGRKGHIEAVKSNGLTITGLKGTHVVRVKATHDPLEVNKVDLLILTTKTRDTLDALNSVSHLYQVVKCAVSLQNGMVKDELLMERFGRDKVIGGATMVGATLMGPGEVEFTSNGITFLGEFDGKRTDRVHDIAEMLIRSGLRAEIVDDIRSVEWAKLILAVTAMALSSLTGLESYKVMKERMLAGVYAQLVREGAKVASKDGAHLRDYPDLGDIKMIAEADPDHAVELVVGAGVRREKAGMTSVVPSMLQSIRKGRKTEVEETIGYVKRKAEELGVDTPAVDLSYRLIKGIEAYLQ